MKAKGGQPQPTAKGQPQQPAKGQPQAPTKSSAFNPKDYAKNGITE